MLALNFDGEVNDSAAFLNLDKIGKLALVAWSSFLGLRDTV